MNNTTTRTDHSGGWGTVIVALVVLAGIVTWALVRWTWRHPVTALVLAVSTAVFVLWSTPGVIALWVTGVVGLIAWRLVGAGSFDRSVSWRARGSLRGWWVYGRRWRPALTMADLADIYDREPRVPKLRRVRSNRYLDRLTVGLLPGQHPADYSKRADTLAHTFGQRACRVRIAGPGRVHLDFTRTDLLATTVPAFAIPETTDLTALPVARQENGLDWLLCILGRHVLIAGVTGAGKGSVLQSVIRALGPVIRSRLVDLRGIDPKGGMELAAAGAERLYTELVRDDPDQQADLLERLVVVMRERARRLAGVTRLHTPTVDEPLIVLVIDELAALTAYRPKTREGRELYARIDQAINLLLSQGRAVGVIVIAALQDPRKEVLPARDLFPTRVALRLVEAEATNMVLGPNARDLGADCSLINPSLPGVAWVWSDGEPEPTRVRFAYPTDVDIAQLADHCHPGADDVSDDQADTEAAEVIELPSTDVTEVPEVVEAAS